MMDRPRAMNNAHLPWLLRSHQWSIALVVALPAVGITLLVVTQPVYQWWPFFLGGVLHGVVYGLVGYHTYSVETALRFVLGRELDLRDLRDPRRWLAPLLMMGLVMVCLFISPDWLDGALFAGSFTGLCLTIPLQMRNQRLLVAAYQRAVAAQD